MDAHEIPSSRKDWVEITRRVHDNPDPLNMTLNSINDFASASKMTAQDIREASMKALDDEPWAKALQDNADDPAEWSTMSLWKHNLDEILRRVSAIKNADDPDVSDNANPFRVELEPRTNPTRRTRPNTSTVREQLRSLSSSTGKSSTPSLNPAQKGRLHSPTAGSLLRVLSQGSTFTALSEDGRTINKHRPDEALVNMTMLLLLQGSYLSLLGQLSHKDYAWSIVHKNFSITGPDPANLSETKKILTARTDGYLQVRRPGSYPDDTDALSIIEVKPYRRHNPPANLKAVRIQEGAEMAAWIATESKKGLLPPQPKTNTYRRLFVSQDYDHVYLTIAEFDDEYVEYVRGSVDEPKDGEPKGGEPKDGEPKGGEPKDDEDEPKGSDAKGNGAQGNDTEGNNPKDEPKDEPQGDDPKVEPKDEPKDDDRNPKRSGPKGDSTRLPKLTVPKRRDGTFKAIKKRTSKLFDVFKPKSPATTAPSPDPPAAPKKSASESPGFLRMIEFEPFNLKKQRDVRELMALLYSLTQYLVTKDLALRAQA